VPISPAASDWNNWIVIEADPNDWHHLLACGDKWSPQANSLSGFLYASFDGGRSWQLKVADSSSGWVSEESCTFGPDGRAYFIADASRLIDGLTRHDLGQTHVYSSKDDGCTWSPPVVWDKWTDHDAVAVDNTVGRRRGAVYVFYNAFQDVKTERVERIEAGAYPVFSPDRSANVDEFRDISHHCGSVRKAPDQRQSIKRRLRDRSLIVGRATSVQIALMLGKLKRCGPPLLNRIDRLDIIVAIAQTGWGPGALS
jgi:hypothetical protein